MPEDFNYKGNKILNVLVTTATGKVTKVQRIQDYGDKHIWRWGRIFGECKAWMPLPQHYKGNKKTMSNVKIYTVDDEEPNCNRCDNVCDSDIVCQQYCGNEHYWNGYSRTEFIDDGE